MQFPLEIGWQKLLQAEFDKPYFKNLANTVSKAYLHETVFPPKDELMTAFNVCPPAKVRVVILGQDPYHQVGQAHGLAFSVKAGVRIPPSLRNIYKELQNDLNITPKNHGNLESWATQGVLLLNASLTVLPGKPGSHQKLGWETFTDAVIGALSVNKNHLVFILWGSFAQSKAKLIDDTKHLILTAPHPSPLSAYTGFFGSKPFSKTNKYLEIHGLGTITW